MKNSTTGYQYKTEDGKQFLSKDDRDKHKELLMEKHQILQEEKYRDEQDHGIPNWLWPDEDHQC
jgi:hypothetical protein